MQVVIWPQVVNRLDHTTRRRSDISNVGNAVTALKTGQRGLSKRHEAYGKALAQKLAGGFELDDVHLSGVVLDE